MSLPQRFPVLALLGRRRYQHYWFSAVLVFGARWMLTVVTGWLVLELTDSAFMVGLAGSLQWIPMLLMGAFVGLVADIINRRILLIFSQISQGLVCVVLGLLIMTGLVQTWHVMLGSLFIGIAWALDFPTRRALIPDLVGAEAVHNAIAMDISAMTLMSALGAISGGELIAAIGTGPSFMVIGALFTLAAVFLFLIGRVAQAVPLAAGNFLGDTMRGIQYVLGNRAILAVMAVTVVINILVIPYRHVLPVFARDILAVGPVGLGYLTGSAGIGAFIGSMVIASLGSIKRPGVAFLAGSFGFGAFLLVFAPSTVYPFSLAVLIVDGLCMPFFGAFQSTILLKEASAEMRGRVMGILSLCIGTMPLGILAFGALADTVGAPLVVGVGAAIASVLVLVIFFAMPSLRRLP